MMIKQIRQVSKFAIVGVVASLCHMAVFFVARQEWQAGEQISNLLGFLCAFTLSWAGHYFWTFRHQGAMGHIESLVKFLCVALSSYGLNAFFVWLIITQIGYRDIYILPFMLLLVPIFTFTLARFWAFRPAKKKADSER